MSSAFEKLAVGHVRYALKCKVKYIGHAALIADGKKLRTDISFPLARGAQSFREKMLTAMPSMQCMCGRHSANRSKKYGQLVGC